jgi:predicted dehydrogenase
MHISVATAAALAGCHLFIEKPLSHNTDGLDALQKVVRERKLETLIGFQFRFHPGLVAVRELIHSGSIGRVTHVRISWGEYLPGWHPWEDYRLSYSARNDLGGGVILTLCHPFDYLRWMLGEVHAVTAVTGHNGGLEIDVEDTADILLEFRSGVIASVHLNYIQRPPSHRLEVIGDSGTVTWDNETGNVLWFEADKDEWKTSPAPVGFERNAMFLAELRHFLDCVAGEAKPLTPLEDGVNTLAVILAAKVSAAEGRRVEIVR